MTPLENGFIIVFFCLETYKDNDYGHPLEIWAALSIPPEEKYDSFNSILTGEAYFKYLEYFEIREALKNSKQSTYIAIAAIAISIIVGIIPLITNNS
ncbi:MAG: hypothetical protein V4581_01635 [Bacteroidota bacterium]